MSFLGPVARLRGRLVRPHDLRVTPRARRRRRARHGRAASRTSGFEVRVELDAEGHERVSAQTTREEAQRLGLQTGERVFLRTEEPPRLSLARRSGVTAAGGR